MSFGVRRGSGALAPRVLATAASVLALTIHSAPGAHALERFAYVVGSNDGRVDRVDLDAGTVVPGIATVGTAANRIEASSDGAWAVVVNSGSDDLSILDLVTESVSATVALPPGTNPWTAEISGDRIFSTSLLRNLVYEIDPWSAAIVDSAGVGRSPEGIALADDKLYVANTGFDFDNFTYDPGTVSVLDATDLSPIATINVGLNPQECLRGPNGRVHVICTGDFWLTEGIIHVIDPATDAVVDSVAVPGYPGGGAPAGDGTIHVNVTTTAFGSEIRSYDAATLGWLHDETDPLLPTTDFYGNVRVDGPGRVLVPNFSQDLLIIEDPAAPGFPEAYLVADGPIDAAVIEREGTVPVLIGGLSAIDVGTGIRLTWRGSAEGDVLAYVVERRNGNGDFARASGELHPAPEIEWTDPSAPFGEALAYRVGAVSFRGDVQWSPVVHAERRRAENRRLAIRRVFPNPFQDDVSLDVFSPAGEAGTLEILDVTGRRVATRDLGPLPRGASVAQWDGRDDAGRGVAPGFYLARLTVGRSTGVARMLRVK